ncbi:MAG: hypothetical protein KIT08_06355 [Anaerolineales bacterium]|nr:MAG: hypothetical protein KIT08_06355 [Anaerolineales bacterium]
MAKKRETLPADPLAEILAAWRLWLLGALLGAVLAWGVYQLWPPNYRARATVVVDANLEEAWQYFPERDLFHFLFRETERMEELAWSDQVLAVVAEIVPGYSVQELRSRVLGLSHPSDGGWRFYATSPDPATAQALASSWAQAFVNAVQAAAVASPDLQAARARMSELLAVEPPDESALFELMTEMQFLAEHTQGISMYTELYVSQAAELPVQRNVSLATYMLLGSVAGALAAPLYVLLTPARLRPVR